MLSVIIPTHDSGRALVRTLAALVPGAAAGLVSEVLITDAGSGDQTVAAAELLQEVHRRLAPDERRLMELRRQGLDWAAIAQEVGDTPVLLRKRLSRALDRVTRDLGLEEPADE